MKTPRDWRIHRTAPNRSYPAFMDAVEPFKVTPPPCACKLQDGRTLTWEDFCFKRGVLLLTMMFDGTGGREEVSHKKAVEMWHDLRPATAKDRTFETIHDVWRHRDRGRTPPVWSPRKIKAGDPAYLTRSRFLSMLVQMIHDDEARHHTRLAKSRVDENGGDKLVHGSGGISQPRAE